MIFYHVSKDLEKDGIFVPRVPFYTREDENTKKERVCVSKTLEGCFSAFPGGGSLLDDTNIEQFGLYKVFRIDTDKLSISPKHIITDGELYQNDWVRDAYLTEEHWITTSFFVPDEDVFYVHLHDWLENDVDIVPYEVMKKGKEEYEGDYQFAYEDIMCKRVPSFTIIERLFYKKNIIKEGETFEIWMKTLETRLNYYVSYNVFFEKLIYYLEKEKNVKVIEIDSESFKVVKGALHIKDLYDSVTFLIKTL